MEERGAAGGGVLGGVDDPARAAPGDPARLRAAGRARFQRHGSSARMHRDALQDL